MTKKLLMGNEAMAHAALEAGVRVVAGYPGTPSSEIVETVAKLHAAGSAHDVHVEWSTNEKAALEVLFGASLAGARGLFTCKQMGLNVASDALMSLNYVSVRGGLVLVVADDPGPISSQTEQDTRRFAAFAKVPVLDPSTPEQAYAMVKAAFDLSERFHTPVIVRPTTRVDHASAFFDVADETFARPVPDDGFQRDVAKWVIFPRRAYEAHGEINERLPQIAAAFATEEPYAAFNERVGMGRAGEPASFGIMAGGISAAYAREALRMVAQRAAAAGVDMPPCRFMQVGTPYPFPEQAVASFASGLGDVLVIEELDHVLEDALTMWVGRTHASLTVHGKLTGEARDRGENDVDDIASRIERFLGLSGRLRLRRSIDDTLEEVQPAISAEELPARPPVLCPGCPHRGAFYAVKQALRGTPAVMCGDIGCYTLGNAKPLDAVDTCLCMGAGITMAQGLSIADPGKKAIAYVGDSTFFASGMTGLANAAYNGHDITVMVLDNATTAMTGSQPHPGTGVTLMGPRRDPLSIEAVLNANNFKRVYHADPLDKDASVVAVKAAVEFEGPSAVIFESPCIQLIKPGAPVLVNPEVCTGCKKCITEIGCPAIGFDTNAPGARSGDRGQAFVDPALCNGCGLCLQVCPFKAIVTLSASDTVAFPPVEVPEEEQLGQAAQSDVEQPEESAMPAEGGQDA
ncbi:MAG: 4Fe-4S binding protein [Eggerthellaceae bacterium]|nr:4Fe-4S binding protein [Eggerthellaceae bacterium]